MIGVRRRRPADHPSDSRPSLVTLSDSRSQLHAEGAGRAVGASFASSAVPLNVSIGLRLALVRDARRKIH